MKFKSGDYSYGLYVYAFPIQQLLIWRMGDWASPVLICVLTVALTLPVAALSWHALEKPALDWLRALRSQLRSGNEMVFHVNIQAVLSAPRFWGYLDVSIRRRTLWAKLPP